MQSSHRFSRSRGPLLAILCALAVLGVLPTTSHALDLKFRGGAVKGGVNLLFNDFQFDRENLLDGDTHRGLAVGVSTHWRLKRRSPWRLVLEGWYLQKGYRGDRSLAGDPPGLRVDVDSEYLSFPVMLRVNFAEDDLTTYAVFGPSLELLLGNDEDELLDDFKSWSLAGGVGMGAELRIDDRWSALLEFRFNTDFTDNFDGPEDVGLSSARHRILLVTTGLRF